MNKTEVKKVLDDNNIKYADDSSVAQLRELLPPDTPPVEDSTVVDTSNDEFTVEDPEILKPKELPLVIKPKDEDWKNEAQAKYARLLNGYAYSNPKKWKIKKAVLLARLSEIGKDEGAIVKYMGNEDKLQIKNKLTQTDEDN